MQSRDKEVIRYGAEDSSKPLVSSLSPCEDEYNVILSYRRIELAN